MAIHRPLELILTHEHTDFDALASLLAASFLFPNALPVLPNQLNRNVREFWALYKNQLPFLTARELPRGHVERAIFVDTRSANWTKGMDRATHFFVIDHHTMEEDVPDGWEIWTEEVGANTTLLVERLIQEQVRLTPVQATLLTLGIHEDTGSLTYSSTTDRDAACLAWLLDPKRRVNLGVVGRFLNHPLTVNQRDLLEQLIEGSEFVESDGHSVAISQATAHGFSDEISALASRLRDYHETDALFLVIDLKDVIQVVARSSTDDIDVGAVARELGGGGHNRAAAAPVHGYDSTEAVARRILELVDMFSRSAVTVHNIMSYGRPQTLTQEMTIDEAYQLMTRYGHEGFPVIETQPDGSERLIGVMTRREADRAINHNLGHATVRRFMRAGTVVVQPNDPISTLRQTMIETNWGQIPVVDETGQIVGIVTRTDLIKLWDESALPELGPRQLATRLQNTLTPVQHHLLQLIGREVDALGYTVYIVGGFTRDLLLNEDLRSRVAALDMDVVIEGDAIDFALHMQKAFGGRVVPHRRFGTAKWLMDDPEYPIDNERLFAGGNGVMSAADLPTNFDFVSARTEFYTAPTVLPTVESGSIKLDLHRRDFTINTLALCLNPERWGELLDFYGGINDLRDGRIRVLHSLSFVDDPTRILRAVRYEQRFGFTIGPRTLELLNDALEMLARVSPARIRHELERILQEPEPERVLLRLDDLSVLVNIHPALSADSWVTYQFQRLRGALSGSNPDPRLADESIERLYWGILTYRQPSDVDEALIKRLALRGETQRLVEALELLRQRLPNLAKPSLRPSQIAALLDETTPAARALTGLLCENSEITEQLRRYEGEWASVRPFLDGNDLQALGLPSGPLYGELLGLLRIAHLDGQIATQDDELALLSNLAEERGLALS